MDREFAVASVGIMRESAQSDLSAQHRDRWPLVSGGLFAAILNALGDISVDEACSALDRIQREAAAATERTSGRNDRVDRTTGAASSVGNAENLSSASCPSCLSFSADLASLKAEPKEKL